MPSLEIGPIFKEGLIHPKGRNKYIITGGPGVGKTYLLLELAKLGFATFPEAARIVIDQYKNTLPEVMPWNNRQKFDELLLQQFIQSYEQHDTTAPAFFDRAIPDYIGWRWYDRMPITDVYPYVSKYPYEKSVFFLPLWKAIYTQDNERPYTFDQASEISEQLYRAYSALGYSPILVPPASEKERAKFVLQSIISV